MAFRDQSGGRRVPGGSEPTEWLTLGQAAKYLGVAQSTLRKWSDREMIPAFYTPGKHRRYRRADLNAFLERSGPTAAEALARVLIVDDDDATRAYVRASLEAEGFEIVEADNARRGLEALENEDDAPDLILLDVMMPGMDGPEVCRRLKADPRTAAVPVVFITALPPETLAARLGDCPHDDVLPKPFTLDGVLAVVRRHLG